MMNAHRSITLLLSFLFLGVAMAVKGENNNDKDKTVARVRRGLFSVQNEANDMYRLSNEFGEGGRDLQEEDLERLLADDMSFSYGDMSYSMSYEPAKKKKGKSRRGV